MSSAGPMGEGDPVRLEVIDRGDPEASDVYVAAPRFAEFGRGLRPAPRSPRPGEPGPGRRRRPTGRDRPARVRQQRRGRPRLRDRGRGPDDARGHGPTRHRPGPPRRHSLGGGTILHVADAGRAGGVRSLTSYGGIGLQEHEGTGDHALEHLKYRIGWWLLVAAPEVVPHFGRPRGPRLPSRVHPQLHGHRPAIAPTDPRVDRRGRDPVPDPPRTTRPARSRPRRPGPTTPWSSGVNWSCSTARTS